jgi:hypothetical protein
MTSSSAFAHAVAIDIRHLDTGALLGVALVFPTDRLVSVLAEGAGIARTPALSLETWREIDIWAADGNARLPAKPAPMSPSITAALLGGEQPSAVSGNRFAAIPLNAASYDERASMAARLLPVLLNERRSAS